MAHNWFKVGFDNSDLTKEIAKISVFQKKKLAEIEDAIRDSTRAVGKGARKRAPVASGTLKKSIRTRYVKKDNYGEAYAKAPHAHLVEFGAKATTIKATSGKNLSVVGSGGKMFFRKTARIPARPGRPFMKPAYEEEKPKLLSNIKKIVNTK